MYLHWLETNVPIDDMYCALVATASDLMSLVNKPVAIKEKMEKKREGLLILLPNTTQKVGALTAEINELNEELQSLSIPGDIKSDIGTREYHKYR